MSFRDLERGSDSSVPYQALPERSSPQLDSLHMRQGQLITNNIQKLSQNVNTISKQSSIIGTPKDTRGFEEELQELLMDTKNLAKQIDNDLRTFLTAPGGSSQERNARKLMHDKLSRNFKQELARFKDVAKVAMEKERQTVATARKSLAQPSSLSSSGATAQEFLKAHKEQESRMQEAEEMRGLQAYVDINESVIRDREEGIRDIQKAIYEINDIFRDLATIVNEQGVLIDNIEANISNSAYNTKKAVAEVQKANEYQKRTRNKMCCLLLLVTVIVAVIVLVLMGLFKVI